MNEGLATSSRFIVVLGLLTALVAFALDISLPAIPPMVHDLATSMSLGQQVVGMFMAGMAIGQLPAGLISDRIGRMPVLYFGIALFTLAGIVTSVSEDINVILGARLVQGIGSSVGMVLARAIVRDISSGKQAARLMSFLVMVFTAAPMIAPLLGAYLVTAWGWQVPFIATTLAGALILVGIKTSLQETHQPSNQTGIWIQFGHSLKVLAAQRQSIFGILVILTTISGIMTIISGSSALVIEIYDFPVRHFGYIFAMTGVAILVGSLINRQFLHRFDPLQMIGVGAAIVGAAGVQLVFMAWLGQADFWWVWGNICLFMCGTAFLLPNATALALEPVPEIAGVAASVMGTVQSLSGAASAIINSTLYTGTILNMTIGVGVSGILVGVIFLFRHVVLQRSLPAD